MITLHDSCCFNVTHVIAINGVSENDLWARKEKSKYRKGQLGVGTPVSFYEKISLSQFGAMLFNHWAQLRPVRHKKSSLLQEGHLGPLWDDKNQHFFMVASFGLVIPRLFIILLIGWSCYIAFIISTKECDLSENKLKSVRYVLLVK